MPNGLVVAQECCRSGRTPHTSERPAVTPSGARLVEWPTFGRIISTALAERAGSGLANHIDSASVCRTEVSYRLLDSWPINHQNWRYVDQMDAHRALDSTDGLLARVTVNA